MNVFDLSNVPKPLSSEFIENLLEHPNMRLERIISQGHVTPRNDWYDQPGDEWVVLIQGQAELIFADGQCTKLVAGDTCWIPAHTRHRVTYTSQEPPCIWLALHLTPT